MGGFMELILFNSIAYMGFLLAIIACIYFILFNIVKISLKNE
jgi:hypothetical protein